MTDLSNIVPTTGTLGPNWPSNANFPQGLHGSLSTAGWTEEGRGFIQQTFLGASIRSFTMKGGFGDSVSDVSMNLIMDEYHTSDSLGLGQGDDIYHNGLYDTFSPPPVGTPVFFKFGKNHATIPEAFLLTMDKMHGITTVPTSIPSIPVTTAGAVTTQPTDAFLIGTPTPNQNDTTTVHTWNQYNLTASNPYRGVEHMAFGGILQSYTQNRGPSANPEYSVSIKDPREILSNVVLILNNYAGTTYNNKNMYNIYGLLEHDPSDSLINTLNSEYLSKDILRKEVTSAGDISYVGTDLWKGGAGGGIDQIPATFPITGQGFARRSESGIPWYRVRDALGSMFLLEIYARLEAAGVSIPGAGTRFPQEFIEAGYGGLIDFRGFKYVVDFSGIPLYRIPQTYYLDFDQIDLLSLVQELCEIISHDFFVSLLPIIDHPMTKDWYDYNNLLINTGDPAQYKNLVVGMIRVDAVDRSTPPIYGSVKRYIDNLGVNGVEVSNEDIGFELSNVTTDKFIAGAQTSEMYFFNTNKDRDTLEVRKKQDRRNDKVSLLRSSQWYHETSLNQQVLPFYGFLGKEAVTIPRGWGSYQQIQLDTTGLHAHGVGNYYIATELELRAASVSYEKWKQFLLQYNDLYMESMEENDAVERRLLMSQPAPGGKTGVVRNISSHYGVSVPRCVFESDKEVDEEGLPLSPCSPPYGYPLYYQRATRIGIPEAGVVKIQAALTSAIVRYAKGKGGPRKQFVKATQPEIDRNLARAVDELKTKHPDASEEQIDEFKLKWEIVRAEIEALQASRGGRGGGLTQIERYVKHNEKLLKTVQSLGEETIENSKKVHAFLKNVADKHLGKTFLVKIPKYVNLKYNKDISFHNYGSGARERIAEIENGPFGFDAIPISAIDDYRNSLSYVGYLSSLYIAGVRPSAPTWHHYLTSSGHLDPIAHPGVGAILAPALLGDGALKNNYNPISEAWEYNYMPDKNGGFLEKDQYPNAMTPKDMQLIPHTTNLPLAIKQKLFPTDPTNFVGNGRMFAYARYDNSQFLSFAGVGKDKMTQDVVTAAGGFVPDITMDLDNTKQDEFSRFEKEGPAQLNDAIPPKSIAFVRCEMDERLYMPAKAVKQKIKVFGREVEDLGVITPPTLLWDGENCKWEESYSYYEAHYIPDVSGGFKNETVGTVMIDGKVEIYEYLRENMDVNKVVNPADIDPNTGSWRVFAPSGVIITSKEFLDSDNVYAVVTMPGRVVPTIDSRFQDGPFQMFQAPLIKHFLTMDTVDPLVKGFDKPSILKKPKKGPQLDANLTNLCAQSSFSDVRDAFNAYKAAIKGLPAATALKTGSVTSPSPVYPNMFALPLMSMERCYGPWISSKITGQGRRYADIGGRIEFVKDESLAPWNYAGYQLLEEAGELQAKFSNSLLLFSERGGFSFPGAPDGVSLCQALINGGPLVTNISVNITDTQITSTLQMDLYTSRFGHLDKQKEIALSKVVRERQKIKDESNALIRKGMGKSRSQRNFGEEFDKFQGLLHLTNQTNTNPPADLIVLQGKKVITEKVDAAGKNQEVESVDVETNVMTKNEYAESAALLTPEQARLSQSNSVAMSIGDQFSPGAEEANPVMPSISPIARIRPALERKHYNLYDPTMPPLEY